MLELYIAGTFETRYNLNVDSLIANAPLFLKGIMGPNGGFVLDQYEYYAQSYPTWDDGYYYLFLGKTASSTSVCLQSEHPVYFYKYGKLRVYGEGGAFVISNATYMLRPADWARNDALGRYECRISDGDITADSFVNVSVIGEMAGKASLTAGIVSNKLLTLIAMEQPTKSMEIAMIIWGGTS